VKLSTSDEANLILTIADILKLARTSPSGTVRFKDTREVHKSVRTRIGEDLDDRLEKVCGEFGLVDFLRFAISREIPRYVKKPKTGLLTNNEGYSDTLEVARRLVKDIAKLPQKLRIISPLPPSFSHVLLSGVDNLEVGVGLRVVSAQWLSSRLNLSSGSAQLHNMVVRNVDLDVVKSIKGHFICTWHSGFAGAFIGNASIQEHLDKVRAFHGCLLALNVVQEDFFFDTLDQHGVLVNDVTESENGELVLTERVDSDLSYFYENFDVSLDYYSVSDQNQADDDSDEDQVSAGASDLSEDEKEAQKQALEALHRPFSKGDYSRRLFTSCLWLFRSFVSTRSLDVILDSTISIEVMLGDRDAAEGLGLTKLLANRCAYLLGKSANERISIMDEFKQIYDIRSQVVHAGLHQTDRKAAEASLKARELAARIINNELKL